MHRLLVRLAWQLTQPALLRVGLLLRLRGEGRTLGEDRRRSHRAAATASGERGREEHHERAGQSVAPSGYLLSRSA